MSLTDLDAARAVADLYDPAIGTDPSKWLHLDAGGDDDQVYWALRDLGPALGLLYRGSILGVDWERDFEAYPYQDPDLGLVHGGMFQGMRKSVEEAHALIAGRPYLVAGHSLGAGRANLATGLGVVRDHVPLATVLWGEPRAGGDRLVGLNATVRLRSYRNTDGGIIHDPVTDLPPALPVPFRHAGGSSRPLLDVVEPPGDFADVIPTNYHHFALYLAATAKLNPVPLIL